jgi:hypothetical protein
VRCATGTSHSNSNSDSESNDLLALVGFDVREARVVGAAAVAAAMLPGLPSTTRRLHVSHVDVMHSYYCCDHLQVGDVLTAFFGKRDDPVLGSRSAFVEACRVLPCVLLSVYRESMAASASSSSRGAIAAAANTATASTTPPAAEAEASPAGRHKRLRRPSVRMHHLAGMHKRLRTIQANCSERRVARRFSLLRSSVHVRGTLPAHRSAAVQAKAHAAKQAEELRALRAAERERAEAAQQAAQQRLVSSRKNRSADIQAIAQGKMEAAAKAASDSAAAREALPASMRAAQEQLSASLQRAIESGDAAAVRTLLVAGVDRNHPLPQGGGAAGSSLSTAGAMPLRAAVDLGHVHLVSLLADHTTLHNQDPTDGATPLHAALDIDSAEVIAALLKAKVGP